jgi:hypothetical protein
MSALMFEQRVKIMGLVKDEHWTIEEFVGGQ